MENQNNFFDGQKEKKNIAVYYYPYLRFIFIIFLVIALGLFVVNQALSYRYKSELLQAPCELCVKLNNNTCIKKCFEPVQVSIYYDINSGDWKSLDGRCYDKSTGREIKCNNSTYFDLSNISLK